MTGKSFFKKILNASFSGILSVAVKPWMIPTLLAAPRSFSVYETVKFFWKDKEEREIENLRVGFLGNNRFFEELNEKMVSCRQRRVNCEGWPEFLYVLIRLTKPATVVETGVFDGISSAVILQALEDNSGGKLISIDLPAKSSIKESTHRMRETALPEGKEPGWVIPDYLRLRHELVLGDSKILLSQVLAQNPSINIFLHDSLHTYECQRFEYETAWPKIKEGGWLLSDDVLWTPAFREFSKKVKKLYKVYCGLGVLRK